MRVKSMARKAWLSYKSVLLILLTLALLSGAGILLHTDQNEIAMGIPVQFEHIPRDMIPVADGPLVLEVHLKGPTKVLQNNKDWQPSCQVDLAAAGPGRLLVKITPAMINTPRRVSVLDINPTSLTVTIDRRAEKTLPVVPDLNGDPPLGYVVARVAATPSTVRLSGPSKILEEISAVRTTPIDMAGLTETPRKKVALNLNHQSQLEPLTESIVEVEIVVEPRMAEKWMKLPVRATGGNKAYVITPDRIEILLRGPAQAVKSLNKQDGVQAYVDLEGLEPGTYVRPVIIKPPLDITLVEAKPEVFTVKVLKKDRPQKP